VKLLLLLTLVSTTVFAQSPQYTFKHIDCNIRFTSTGDFLNTMARQKLADKSFIVKDFVDGDRMNVGDLYFTLEYVRDPKKLWKDCIVNVAIKKAKGQKALPKDKVLYSRSIKRALPRHTFNGNERCTRALKDAFIHIPYCQTMTVNEKVQGN
jgi:hypothetical protein